MADRDVARALLDAVDAALRENAVSSLSLRDVARRAGVSHASPAHFFGNKAGVCGTRIPEPCRSGPG
jgi:AcrR family transcriptional regulator